MADKELPAKESLKLGIISLLIFAFLYFSNPNQGHDYVNNFKAHGREFSVTCIRDESPFFGEKIKI